MTVSERRKGLRGQQEVQRLFREHGIDLSKLAARGDRAHVTMNGTRLHLEVKRQERARVKEWLAQAEDEAPAGAIPVVCFRQSRGEWYAILPLADLIGLVR